MIGLLIAVVVIAVLIFVLLRRMPEPKANFEQFFGIPIYTSPYVPPGTMYLFSRDLLDFTRQVRYTERISHDELWYRLARPPVLLDPKAIVKINVT